MSFFKWTDDLSVNVRRIDEQHKGLVNTLNELFDSMVSGKSQEILGNILAKLVNYAKVHFMTEENLLKHVDFPEFEQHKKEHDAFAIRIDEFMAQYKEGNARITVPLLDYLKQWLSNHIMGTDRKYIKLLNDNNVF